jgi:hypothetical protein
MTPEAAIQAQHEARLALIEYATIRADRDNRIKRAAALGISKSEIARLARMNRPYIYKILDS